MRPGAHCGSRCLPKQKSTGVGKKVGEHAGGKVPPEDIQSSQDHTSETSDHEMRPSPAIQMRKGKRRKRDQRCEPAQSRKFVQSLNHKAAIEDFLEHRRAKSI